MVRVSGGGSNEAWRDPTVGVPRHDLDSALAQLPQDVTEPT